MKKIRKPKKVPSTMLAKMLSSAVPQQQYGANIDLVDQQFQQALVLHRQGQTTKARQLYELVLSIQPSHVEAISKLGLIFAQHGQIELAIKNFLRSLQLEFDQPDVWANCGNAFQSLGRHQDALDCSNNAISLDNNFAVAHFIRGNALSSLGGYEDALVSYQRAVLLDPQFVNAQWEKGIALLRLGEFVQGWQLYEWRWRRGDKKPNYLVTKLPLWHIDSTINRLLVWTEQGFGDAVFFASMLTETRARVQSMMVMVDASLLALFQHSMPNISFIAKNSSFAGSAYDAHLPMGSLGQFFRNTPEDFVNVTSPYLFADADRQVIWQQRLGSKTKPRIGLVWSGSTIHTNDHNRSIPLSLLEKLTMLDAEFHSLQKEIRDTDQQYLAQFNITAHAEQLTDFAETAALVAEMDLIISVDTSVAHLAGAMGRPVWVLLPFAPDFRWLLNRTDSPWYPTARLFRQPAIGDWEGVMVEVARALAMQFSVTIGQVELQ